MRRPSRWLALAAPLLLLSLTFVSREGEARPGGGNTYRGSSSSGSSSSGSSSSYSSSYSRSSSSWSSSSGSSASGSTDIGGFFCTLVMLLMLFSIVVSVKLKEKSSKDWSTTAPRRHPPGEDSARELLARLRTVGPRGADGQPVPFDPDFSLVLFEDFLYALYAKAHEARGGGRVDTLAAYLSGQAREALRGLGRPARVKAVVVGSMQYLQASPLKPSSTRVEVRLRFEANYTEVSESGAEQSYYVAEDWTLSRSTRAKSRTPERVRLFKCPNCGAPLEAMQGDTCSYCSRKVDTGEFDWVVSHVEEQARETRGPQLTGDTPEEGTHLPTVKQQHVNVHMLQLLEEDPELSWDAITQRIGLIFQELQVAWSNREWTRARPYVSDGLFQTQLYWMQAYRQAGLRNVTENARITCIELARVVRDKHYDALTVRVFATGLDFTVRDSDKQLVSGSWSHERPYSEYWTLIRGMGTKGRPSAEKRCPSCGAPQSFTMAGNCAHCSAKVTSGEFDWVLSRIEQDESYRA